MGDEERERLLKVFMEETGAFFTDMALLDQALTHGSVMNDDPDTTKDYESLEFLGDAALELAISQALYARISAGTPGEFTQLRSRIVNKHALAGVARQLNIGRYIRLGKGEELAGGRERDALLADCVESVLGALQLDSGFSSVQEFAARHFGEMIDEAVASSDRLDYRSRLQNYCQAKKIALPEFRVTKEEGPDHAKIFEVEVLLRGESLGSGRGTSKKEAEQLAAREALEREGV